MGFLSGLTIRSAFAIKITSALVGAIVIVISLGYLVSEIGYLTTAGFPGLVDTIFTISILGASLSGIALLAELPNSLRKRFRRPPLQHKPKEVYGFVTMCAIGLGSTLGSPLFILIPLNIVQYQIVSIGSLILAMVLSIMMAKTYSRTYQILKKNNLDSVGGPAFLKAATGSRSVRYFVSRVSMMVANTALAAYSAIVFVLFNFEFMPGMLADYGITGAESVVIIYSITGLFLVWFVLNSVLESRFIKLIGKVQIILTSVMAGILLYQSYLLGSTGSWNFAGLFSTKNIPGGNLALALVINTAYLYLLFFGFQEIQAMEREAKETSKIPVVSWIKKNFILPKTRYIDLAMIFSVVIASIVNIFYALAVYASHPSVSSVASAQIPALFLANQVLGLRAETFMALAFLIATFTTFVPAFLAASRHISSLAEDGFIPLSISKVSWLFVVVSIGILSVAGEDFLVNITDFMVLVSLGLIAFAAIWIRKNRRRVLETHDALPIVTGFACLFAAAAVYLFSPSVAIFGSVAIVISYLLFDVFELGSLGIELFLGVFDMIMYILLTTYPQELILQNFFFSKLFSTQLLSTNILSQLLLLSSLLLFANFGINFRLKGLQSTTRVQQKSEVSNTA